ncbi:DUF1284 domain-containing protein [Schinkia sp. CFF1]
MGKRILRGHHLLCVHGFRGMGYSPTFVEKMSQVVEEIRNPELDYPIQVVQGLDETCSYCPNKGDGFCNAPKADAFVMGLDHKIISHLGIQSGAVYNKSELVSLVAKKVKPDDLDYLCEGCSWLNYGVCKEGIAKLNHSSLLK